MQKENSISNNKIQVIGKISSAFTFSHQVYGEGFYNFCVGVQRLSDVDDILPITVSERLSNPDSLPMGTRVRINGQIRSYNNTDNAQGTKNKLILTIFAREIEVLDQPEDKFKNPNDVFLSGYICKSPVYRQTPFGREITDILLAVNRAYNKSDYIPCIAWGRNSRYAGGLGVGENIKIWGRMQSRDYQKKYEDGSIEDRVAYEVSIAKLESKDESNDYAD